MNYKIIINIIGFLVFITGIFMMVGIPFSIYYKSDDIQAILLAGISTSFVGGSAWFLTRKSDRSEVGKREGYIIVTLGWILMSAFGATPFVIHGSIPSYTDAFFETMSGFTTTGASILKEVEVLPYGLMFWRSMTHWIGGMGIIVLSIAILPLLGIGGMQLYQAEVAGPTKDKLHPRVRETAKRLWAIYFFLTSLEVIFLLFGDMSLLDALCHSFGSLATGGFSTRTLSVAYYNSAYIEYVILFFMFLGGTNFTLHYLALHGKIKSYLKDDEFKFYLGLIAITVISLTVYLVIANGTPIEKTFRNVAFSILSILTSTGFATADYELWAPFASMFFLIILLLGACAGSTSGGVKMIRYQLLLKNSIAEVSRLLHPNAIIPVRHNGKSVPNEILAKVSAFVLTYLAIFVLGSLLLTMTGLDIKTSLGSVAACMANIGPGLGQTGPAGNYSEITVFGKWLLSFLMLLGRLELFTVLIIFTPYFWKK
ncbi:MAG: TrkH family potassium uptake protein [Ignavibacterium sp.]|nr:TrkH family potassium uptake protein [Ignavibacterium sp.]